LISAARSAFLGRRLRHPRRGSGRGESVDFDPIVELEILRETTRRLAA
jgi:hypothetical protein